MSIPTQLGPYRIDRWLGGGGFADVYLAVDTRSGGQVALKVLKPEHATGPGLKRFLREGQQMLALRHPGLVAASEASQVQGCYFIAMAYMPGGSLADVLKQRGRLDLTSAAQIADQVAAALDYLHPRLVHRDLKPSNVLFDATGRAHITDLGIAHMDELSSITGTGTQIGTPGYMAPEQVNPRLGRVGPATDAWALGVIIYEMLCGQPPFMGEDSQAVLYQVVHEQPPLPSALQPDLPKALEKVLTKALAKNSAQRYQRATELAHDLRQVARSAAATQARPIQPIRRPTTPRPRTGLATLPAPGRDQTRVPVWLAAAGGAVFLSVVVLVIALGGRNAATRVPSATPVAISVTSLSATSTEAATFPAATTAPTRPAATPVPRSTATPTPAPTFTLLPSVTPRPVARAGGTINVRTGPSTTFPLVAQAREGMELTVQARNAAGDWWQVCCLNGQSGWALKELLLTDAALDPPVAAEVPTPPVPGRVVFVSDRSGFAHLFTVDGNGRGLRALTSGQEYFWDPVLDETGAQLAFTSKAGGNTEIFVAASNGSNRRQISNHPAEDDHASWFPGGAALAFASNRDGPWEIYRMNADGSAVRRLTTAGGDNRFTAVSPDSSLVAYVSQGGGYPLVQLMVVPVGGGVPRPVLAYNSRKQRDDPGRFVYRPDWSPDGAWLAFGADDDDDGVVSIVLVNVQDGSTRRVIRDGNGPAWSPDGSQIIYKPAGDRQVLYVADADGNMLYRLTGAEYNAWSPDWAR